MTDRSSEMGSVSRAIVACGGHDAEAAQLIWERYFERLCGYVRMRIYPRHRRHFDEEDIAQTAFHALFDGLRHQRFVQVRRRDELWQMLALIAARKTTNAAKQADRKKRGGGKVLGESALGSRGFEGVTEFVQAADDESFAGLGVSADELIARLPDESLRRVAMLRLSGCSVDEIARQLNRVPRTVERKLAIIRKLWM